MARQNNQPNEEPLSFFEKISQHTLSKKHIEHVISSKVALVLLLIMLLGLGICWIGQPDLIILGSSMIGIGFGCAFSQQLYSILRLWLYMIKEKEFSKFLIGLVFVIANFILHPSLIISVGIGIFIKIALSSKDTDSVA